MVGGLVYLIDTNIWLELFLEQEKADVVRDFIHSVDSTKCYITDFSIYSIGIILLRFNKKNTLVSFLTKVILESGIHKIVLDEKELIEMLTDDECNKLDFDDANQYYYA
jgi:uncharacterized protein